MYEPRQKIVHCSSQHSNVIQSLEKTIKRGSSTFNINTLQSSKKVKLNLNIS